MSFYSIPRRLSRPYGTNLLNPVLIPALKCRAIVIASLRDAFCTTMRKVYGISREGGVPALHPLKQKLSRHWARRAAVKFEIR